MKDWISRSPPWLLVRAATTHEVIPRLHSGESEAIRLALELKAPLLIDDMDARVAAKNFGLTPIGTIGILEIAAIAGFTNLRVALQKLQQTTHRNMPALIEAALERFDRMKAQ